MELNTLTVPTHEHVVRVTDADSGLTGFIALHSTALGPAAGGLRMRRYDNEEAALDDVLRLSRGMTFKNAAAGLPLGGGKAVIIGDPRTEKTPARLAAMGRAVESLKGRYWTAEDMGMSPADMAVVAAETGHVAGLPDGPFASGDPSPITARGIFNAIRTTARHRFGTPDLAGRRVAVQGLGHVGQHLCSLLHEAGARLTVADIDPANLTRAETAFGATIVAPEEILRVEADILAPCAIGAILNETTIPALRVSAVAGGANNQLASDADATRLHQRGILYAPDYVSNAGGIINVATEILKIRNRDRFVADKLIELDATLDAIFSRASAAGESPHQVADATVSAKMRRNAA